MDDLYDNLENYNDTNVIEELRNENQELKAKVDKCTATIERLQKDFDKLETEYKKLELNYSSLLKTARAEVERKTQIIMSLNHEKDMMVLNAIQNKNVLNIRRNWPQGKAKSNQPQDNNGDSNNKKTAPNQLKSRSSSTGRKEALQTPSEDTTMTASTGIANKPNIKNEKSMARTSDSKENVGESPPKGRPARAGSIRCRRKSMPATRLSKFSSDEEGEISSPPRNLKANEPIARESDAWGSWDRNYSRQDRLDCNPYNRVRNYDNDKFRSRDRFEAQRNRFSPERFHRRSKKDYLVEHRSHRMLRDGSGGYRSDKDGEQRSYRDGSGDRRQYSDRLGDCRPHRDGSGDHKPRREDSGDRYQRPEHRKRRLESPPRDKYYQYQQKNHEQFEKDYYDEKNKYLEDPTRVKYLSDFEEPSHKRLRTDSHHSSEHESRGHRGPDPDFVSQPVVGTLQLTNDMSCQSPDYLATELATVPKEIKLDTEVKLDDPREQSDKYTIRTENGEKVLSTVVGRNVDLMKLKSLTREMPKIEVPKALVIPPSHCTDSINNIYDNMDVDNPASDISSVESGETMGSIYDIAIDSYQYRSKKLQENDIQLKANVCKLPFSYQRHAIHTDVKNPEKETMMMKNNNQNLQVTEKDMIQTSNPDECAEKPAVHLNNVAEIQQSCDKGTDTTEKITAKNEGLKTYLKRGVTAENVTETADIQSYHVVTEARKVDEVPRNHEKVDKQIGKLESTSKITPTFEKYKIPKINRDRSRSCEKKHMKDKLRKNIESAKHDIISKTREVDGMERIRDQEPVVDTAKGMVEGDLELSDENSDNIELVKRVTKEIYEQSMPDLNKPSVENIGDADKQKEPAELIKQISSSNNLNEKNIVLKQKIERKTGRETSDRNNKSKIKGKAVIKESKSQTQAPQTDKTVTLNKETKQKTPETIMARDIKNKFSDLFGDTSSLITPEDLGLTATEIRIESSSTNYFPIFEDAQDAIDLGNKVTDHTNKVLPTVSYEESCIDEAKASKNSENKVQNEPIDGSNAKSRTKLRKLTDTENEHRVKPMEVKEMTSKCSKNIEKEKQLDKNVEANESKRSKYLEKQHHGNKKIDVSETKAKTKTRKNTDTDIEKQPNPDQPATEHQEYPDKRIEVEGEEHKSKSSKSREVDLPKALDENKSTKTIEKEKQYHGNKKIDVSETKAKTKSRKNTDTEKQLNPYQPTIEHQEYLDKRMEVDGEKPKSKSSKSTEVDLPKASDKHKSTKTTEKEHNVKKVEIDDSQTKHTETKRRKSKRNEEKSQLTKAIMEKPQPAVITVENTTTPTQTTVDIELNDIALKDVVKTVVISSGVQPIAREMPVNNFSPILLEPPVTPNIDMRQTRVEIPLMSHSVHIHALATSTPAKELSITNVQEDASGTPDVSNASDQTSRSNVNSHNDMEAPDVRIFVKRRKRVVKKTTPSKT